VSRIEGIERERYSHGSEIQFHFSFLKHLTEVEDNQCWADYFRLIGPGKEMRPKKKIDRRGKKEKKLVEKAGWVGLVGLVGPVGSVPLFFLFIFLFLFCFITFDLEL
jgi:hypothetical protein